MQLKTITNEIDHLMTPDLWNTYGLGDGDKDAGDDYAKVARQRAGVILDNRPQLLKAINANAIDSQLSTQAIILQEALEEFKIPILALNAFSAVFNDVPLKGTDKVEVAYYPLQTAASNTYDSTQGYAANLMAGTTTQKVEILVGGDGNTATSGANAAANTVKDRKFIGMALSSYELARQPALNRLQLARLNAAKLGVDVFKDVVSRLITAANFGAAALTLNVPSLDGSNVADLALVAGALNWPLLLRSLVVDYSYCGNLLKDAGYRDWLANGMTDPETQRAGANAYSFGAVYPLNGLAAMSPSGEKLIGFIAHKAAAAIATSPILPTKEVARLLTRYEIVADPGTGVSFEYRKGGNPITDTSFEVVEVNYGGVLGKASALRRICTT